MSEKLSLLERVKVEGDALRGTIAESLHDELTGSMREEDTLLMKFHGMYQQDDRDRREERAQKKLERLFSFMIRLRMPGGILTAGFTVTFMVSIPIAPLLSFTFNSN